MSSTCVLSVMNEQILYLMCSQGGGMSATPTINRTSQVSRGGVSRQQSSPYRYFVCFTVLQYGIVANKHSYEVRIVRTCTI